tara:strand:+ start:28942 stop:29787 length:846 start_codon:yes stop_codon:yes gene_type:complete
MKRTFVIAEVGINHNGSMDLAKKLIDTAVIAGCDAVKFQKRDIHEVYSPETLAKVRESPWGNTYLEQKEGLEFSEEQLDYINDYCGKNNIAWFASCWDLNSQRFMRKYDLKYNKVASPMLTVTPLLEEIAVEKKHTFVSTGMSTIDEIDTAVEIFKKHECSFELMHCVSAYPLKNDTANLSMIPALRRRYAKNVGYSGHEKGLQISLAAVAMGATSVERHITLDRAMYGSDQAASIEPDGLIRLVRDIRIIDAAMGTGEKILNDFEQVHRDKLATPYWVTK